MADTPPIQEFITAAEAEQLLGEDGEQFETLHPIERVEPSESEQTLRQALGIGRLDPNQRVTVPRNITTNRNAQAITDAFHLVGGVYRLAAWADENYSEFLKLFARTVGAGSMGTPELSDANEKIIKHVLPPTKLDS